jgi:flagellar biogenesis protein FliO
MSVGDYLSRLMFALPLVLLMAGTVLYFAKRGWLRLPGMAGAVPRVARNDALRIIQSQAIGPGVRLVVIQFDERSVLLGVSRSGVTALSHGERP